MEYFIEPLEGKKNHVLFLLLLLNIFDASGIYGS